MSNVRLDPPRTVREIASRLEEAGYETWCVGGAVRDALLGHVHLDWDLATSAPPQEVRKLFKRTVPVGMEFGTVGVLDADNVMHEVTTFRRDVQTDGRHAVVEFGVSLADDLARRDYTINAIAYSPSRDVIADPFDGQKDLAAGVIRAVGDPRDRMREDRLRALRAIRFASRFEFAIEKETRAAIGESAPFLSRLSAERVKQEIEKTMDQVVAPSKAFRMWKETGAFATLVPPLAAMPDAHFSVLDHICPPTLKGRPQRKIARLTALFSALDPSVIRTTLKALRFSNLEQAWISGVAESWQKLRAEMTEALTAGPVPDDAIRKWAAATGRTRLAPVLRLAAAHWASLRVEPGHSPQDSVTDAQPSPTAPDASVVRSVYRRAIRIAYHDPIELADLAIDGSDVERAGIRGPAVGETLRNLLGVVINDPARNTRDHLLGLIVAPQRMDLE